MHADLQALLDVQTRDLAIFDLEARRQLLEPRLAALERKRAQRTGALDAAVTAVEQGESAHRAALQQMETHRALVERSQSAYESVTTPREATAAMTQLEQTRRMLADSEGAVTNAVQTLDSRRHEVAELEASLSALEAEQGEARATIAAEQAAIDQEIAGEHSQRATRASDVPASMLSLYDRVTSRRRAQTLFPLRGVTCSSCDTALPTQRRVAMQASKAIELCEGCGSLLYAAD